MGVACVLVAASLWAGESGTEAIAKNAGQFAIVACLAAVVGAVLISRWLMDRNDP